MSSIIFVRAVAVIYLIAFASLGVQVLGLIGSQGILPVGNFLKSAGNYWGAQAFWHLPTLCWINTSDVFLLVLCAAGVVFSIVLLIGFFPALNALLLWILYLSLTVAGQDFLGFQWDNLLLETGLLCVFLYGPLTRHMDQGEPSKIIIWLLRWLLFWIMFESGMVKILSKDPVWANATALSYHYLTQPLPNMISWFFAQLPDWFHRISCVVMFAIELVVPFMIFCGRRVRFIAFGALAGLQVLIILTGNYCFFNLLVIALCWTLLDDDQINKILPFLPAGRNKFAPISLGHLILSWIVAVFIFCISASVMVMQLTHIPVPQPIVNVIRTVSPFRSINAYGLFAVMTTERNEIIIEGSNDGELWLTYEFLWKPGNLGQAPKWVMPYQPRLDWQMWFAALGDYRQSPWFMNFLQRLLEGAKPVAGLLKENPFKEKPPKYIRASFYEYHFTDPATRRKIHAWWQRQYKGSYCPVVSLPE